MALVLGNALFMLPPVYVKAKSFSTAHDIFKIQVNRCGTFSARTMLKRENTLASGTFATRFVGTFENCA